MKDTYTAASIFNENLQVTEEMHAVTFAKRSYNSLGAKDNLLAAEHAFIIIQTPQMFYRAEIAARNDEPNADMVIHDGQYEFVSERGFEQGKKSVLHKRNLEHIINHTWLVPKDKVAELLADIAKDMGSEEVEEKKAVPFFAMGNESLKYEGKSQDFAIQSIKTISMLFAMCVSVYGLEKTLEIKFFHNAHSCLPQCETDLIRSTNISLLSGLGTVGNYLLQQALPGKEYFPTVHSCATWAAEKLHNLKIEEIDKDLNASMVVTLVDKLGFLTTLHMNNPQEVELALEKQPVSYKIAYKGLKSCVDTADKAADVCVEGTVAALRVAVPYTAAVIVSTVAENCFNR